MGNWGRKTLEVSLKIGASDRDLIQHRSTQVSQMRKECKKHMGNWPRDNRVKAKGKLQFQLRDNTVLGKIYFQHRRFDSK